MASETYSRRNFIRSAIAGAAAGATGGGAWADAKPDTRDSAQCGSVWERPAKQTGNNLNLLVIVSDTFRHDNLACYGPKWLDKLETPNLDRFSEKAVTFRDAYAEGMPTLVIRRTLYTGRRVIPTHYFRQQEQVQLPGWHPIYNEDVTLSETLNEAGYTSTLISSLYHQFKPSKNFHRGFHTWRWVRGLEFDYYGTSPHGLLDIGDLVSSDYLARFPGIHSMLSQYKANRNLWQQHGESVGQLTAQEAIRWLNDNHGQRPFYLQVEFFNPHEPWDPPRRFLEKYMANASGPSFIEPPYDTVPLSDEIKTRFRANYAGAVSCVDNWIGNLLDTIQQFGLFENTVVVFMSDHGAMLGERGQFLKGPDKLRGQVTHIPLLVQTPGNPYAGRKVPGFVQVPDVMPTLLSLLDLKPPSRVTGTNVWPLVTEESKKVRDSVVHTYGWVGAVRNHEWSYSEIWQPEAYQEQFHVSPGTPVAIYKPQLYNLEQDPKELTDVAEKYPDIARQMSAMMKDYIAPGQGMTSGSFNEKESLDTSLGLDAK
ncbi:MAG TPA: sulfatase [Acidobacteriaceae bacterium]|nr:sulfatase [Acidobacteriaceae bacterium]